MIKLKSLITEKINGNDYGCLMAGFPKESDNMLINFGKKLVSDEILYFADDDVYGREQEPHTTILYGFTKDITEDDVKEIINGVKPFIITANKLDAFTNEDKPYDVVILKVVSDKLNELNKKCKSYPNYSEFPNYHPHITLAYVKKGTFKDFPKDINVQFLVDKVFYSSIIGNKFFIKL